MIITGHPRSGTTLLTSIIASHPETRVSFEFRNFFVPKPYPDYIKRLRSDWYKRRLTEGDVRDTMLNWKKTLKSMYFYYAFRFYMREFRNQTVTLDNLRHVLYRVYSNAKIIGDKFPPYARNLDQLITHENCRLVFIYRDVRDVIPSAIRHFSDEEPSQTTHQIEKFATSWVEVMQKAHQYREKLHLIRYENLLANPKDELQHLGAYLNIDAEKFDSSFIRQDNKGKFKSELTNTQIQVIQKIAGQTMDLWGY